MFAEQCDACVKVFVEAVGKLGNVIEPAAAKKALCH